MKRQIQQVARYTKGRLMDGTAPFFVPAIDEEFREHYHAIHGRRYSDEQIRKNVYGGLPLTELYQSITFEADSAQIEAVKADITLNPASLSPLPPIVIRDASLRQFLISGFPLQEWRDAGYLDSYDLWTCRDVSPEGMCLNRDYWSVVDPHYRLEICHSEISRWSIFFKRDGDTEPRGGANIENHEHFGRIELVNNCTTNKGFEFRLSYGGQLYHASFGDHDGSAPLRDVYTALSERQGGSLAKQDSDYITGRATFWTFYGASSNKGPDTELVPTINLEVESRYGAADTSATPVDATVEINCSTIDYARWGPSSEYFQKAQVRRLMYMIAFRDGSESKQPPEEYAQIKNSLYIELPQFQESGIYDFRASERQRKQGYRWLYGFTRSRFERQADGRYRLSLLRDQDGGEFQFRRILIGNLSLGDIPIYPEIQTLHRFGYGVRDTSQDYNPAFRPPTDPSEAAPYSFLFAGRVADSARNYITPESFGIERLVLSRDSDDPRRLVLDVISFERILPLWQGSIQLPDEVLEASYGELA